MGGKKFATVLKIFFILFVGIGVTLYLLTFFPQQVSNTTIGGISFRPQIWSEEITITKNVWFVPWVTLTIQPGTKIFFNKTLDPNETNWKNYTSTSVITATDPTDKNWYKNSHYSITAKIMAIGKEDQPIIFTSAQREKEYADWNELNLYSNSELNYVEVAYTRNGLNLQGNRIKISNSKIHDSLWNCLTVNGSENIINDSEIYHCWIQAIEVKQIGANTFMNNNIHDATIGISCENGAKPKLSGNQFKAAPFSNNCPTGDNNANIIGKADIPGGTFNNILVRPAN